MNPERRISTRLAATYLGVDRKHVVRLIRCGALDGVDVRLPGAGRPCWAVSMASLRRFLASRADSHGLNGPSAAATVDSDGARTVTGR